MTAGLELLVTSLTSLSILDITLLDNYSWASIVNIGTVCVSLTKFHLQLWREDMTDVSALDLPEDWRLSPTFSNVQVFSQEMIMNSFLTIAFDQDLKIKCEEYVEFLPEQVFEHFFQQCSNLRVAQLIGPVDWIMHDDILDVFLNNSLTMLEVLVISNTSSQPMNLGLDTVMLLLEKCPNIVGLGDLKTWMKIDYFDPDSDLHYNSKSSFVRLREEARAKNWELDLDVDKFDTPGPDMIL